MEHLEPIRDDVPDIVFNRVLALFAAGRVEDARIEAQRLSRLAPHWRGLPLYADGLPGAVEFLENT